MASSNVTSLHNRIQFSVDQAVKATGNSFVGTALDRHNADTQGALYNLKGATNDAVRSDVPTTTTNSTANPSLIPPSINLDMVPKEQFGHIKLDISNSVLPFDKLASTPSSNDGLSEDIEHQIRSLGCELIQLAGKLLKLPQVGSQKHSTYRFPYLGIMGIMIPISHPHTYQILIFI